MEKDINLKIAVSHVNNGQVVFEKRPGWLFFNGEPHEEKYCFEKWRDIEFDGSDSSKSLHYHLGKAIDDYIKDFAKKLDFDVSVNHFSIEIIVKGINHTRIVENEKYDKPKD